MNILYLRVDLCLSNHFDKGHAYTVHVSREENWSFSPSSPPTQKWGGADARAAPKSRVQGGVQARDSRRRGMPITQ